MIARLKISDIDIDSINFDRNDLTSEEYIQMMDKYENTTGQVIGDFMVRNNGVFTSCAKFNRRNIEDSTKYTFPSCLSNISNIANQDLTIQELKEYAQSGEQFIIIAKIDLADLENDSDFETNLKQWRDNYIRLRSYAEATDEWVLKNTQSNDIILSVEETNENFMMHNCKIVSIENNDTYAFCVLNVASI